MPGHVADVLPGAASVRAGSRGTRQYTAMASGGSGGAGAVGCCCCASHSPSILGPPAGHVRAYLCVAAAAP